MDRLKVYCLHCDSIVEFPSKTSTYWNFCSKCTNKLSHDEKLKDYVDKTMFRLD